MKRLTICVVAALVAALAVCAIAGCSSQSSSSAASASSAQSQEEITAELKNAMWFKDAPTPCEDAPDKRMQIQVKAFREKILG